MACFFSRKILHLEALTKIYASGHIDVVVAANTTYLPVASYKSLMSMSTSRFPQGAFDFHKSFFSWHQGAVTCHKGASMLPDFGKVPSIVPKVRGGVDDKGSIFVNFGTVG